MCTATPDDDDNNVGVKKVNTFEKRHQKGIITDEQRGVSIPPPLRDVDDVLELPYITSDSKGGVGPLCLIMMYIHFYYKGNLCCTTYYNDSEGPNS